MGLSCATYYRHAPYHARATGTAGTASASGCSQSSTFSSSFETFLNNSANLSGSDGDTSYANEDRDQVITGRYIRTDNSESETQKEHLVTLTKFTCF